MYEKNASYMLFGFHIHKKSYQMINKQQEWIAYEEKETEFSWTHTHQTGGHNCKDAILSGLTKWSDTGSS